ncbi:hypothetical protein AAFF_G00370160 [Aldrovandia affinis]|uniref:Uncharacterized protein n=1 Tax=Aldrovandia affinis TaxID=143900 RepID=A0AAD7SGI8_9TELE|nr:hypothetical protein AAFF_G00370160 [Aldrovandia affinis]
MTLISSLLRVTLNDACMTLMWLSGIWYKQREQGSSAALAPYGRVAHPHMKPAPWGSWRPHGNGLGSVGRMNSAGPPTQSSCLRPKPPPPHWQLQAPSPLSSHLGSPGEIM